MATNGAWLPQQQLACSSHDNSYLSLTSGSHANSYLSLACVSNDNSYMLLHCGSHDNSYLCVSCVPSTSSATHRRIVLQLHWWVTKASRYDWLKPCWRSDTQTPDDLSPDVTLVLTDSRWANSSCCSMSGHRAMTSGSRSSNQSTRSPAREMGRELEREDVTV